MRRGSLQLLPNIDGADPLLDRGELARQVAHLFDAPMGNRIQRWRAEGLARAQAETGVMPGASDGIADEEPRFKWSAVVCTDGTDGEQLVAAPDKEHGFASRVPKQHGPFRNRREFNSLGKVRSVEFRLFFAHSSPLSPLSPNRRNSAVSESIARTSGKQLDSFRP